MESLHGQHKNEKKTEESEEDAKQDCPGADEAHGDITSPLHLYALFVLYKEGSKVLQNSCGLF